MRSRVNYTLLFAIQSEFYAQLLSTHYSVLYNCFHCLFWNPATSVQTRGRRCQDTTMHEEQLRSTVNCTYRTGVHPKSPTQYRRVQQCHAAVHVRCPPALTDRRAPVGCLCRPPHGPAICNQILWVSFQGTANDPLLLYSSRAPGHPKRNIWPGAGRVVAIATAGGYVHVLPCLLSSRAHSREISVPDLPCHVF